MAGGHTPANETALGNALDRKIARAYPTAWAVHTTRMTPGRGGIPDRLICIGGRLFAFELKHPTRPSPLKPRQRRELYELGRAGATVAVIQDVDRAMAILGGEDPGDPWQSFASTPQIGGANIEGAVVFSTHKRA